MYFYITYDDFDLLKAIKKASGKITRKQAKAVHKDLPPGGVWRTIRGHHVYILNGKIVGGATFLQGKASKLDEDTHKKIQDFVTKRAKKDALNELRDHVMKHGVSHDDLMEKFGHSDVHRQALQEYAQKHGIADHEAVNNWNKIRSNRGKQDTHYRARAGLHKDYYDWKHSLSDDEKKHLIQDVAKHKLNSYILYLKWRKNHKELLKDTGDEKVSDVRQLIPKEHIKSMSDEVLKKHYEEAGKNINDLDSQLGKLDQIKDPHEYRAKLDDLSKQIDTVASNHRNMAEELYIRKGANQSEVAKNAGKRTLRDYEVKHLPNKELLEAYTTARDALEETTRKYENQREYNIFHNNMMLLKAEIDRRREEKPQNTRNQMVVDLTTEPWYVLKRGDKAIRKDSNGNAEIVTIQSISHAKKTINGRHPSIFKPLDLPKLDKSKEPKTFVKAEQPKKEDKPKMNELPKELDPTKRKPLDAVNEVLKQIQTGKMSAANLRKFVDIYMSNRAAITDQIYNENVKQNPAHKRRRDTTKRRIAEDMYTSGLMSVERHAFGNARILWQGDRATVSAERLKHLSDDDLKQRYLDAYASKEERLAALPEKYKNPTTLEEYRYKQSRVGLSPEEEKQLNKLYDEEEHKRATQSWNKREQEQQQAAQTAQQTQPKPKVTSTSSDYTMHEDIHTKTGAKLHIIKPNKRLSKDEFNQLRNTIKRDHGGYYSKFKRGFIMPSKEEAEKFMSKQGGSAPATEAPKEQPKKAEAPHKQQANKLRELADKMQEQINHLKYNTDRKTDTHRRARIAASMEKEGDKLEQLQGVMRQIAHDIENGKTTFLKNVKTKADVETLLKFAKRIKGDKNNLLDEHIRGQQLPNMRVSPYWVKYVAERIKNVPGQKRFAEKMLKLAKDHEKLATNTVPPITERYRDDLEKLVKLGKEHGDKYHTDYIKEAMADRKRLEKMGITSDEYFRSAMREFKKYLNNTGVSEEELKQRELKQRVSEAARMNIPSYFPTPKPVVSRMIEDADIKPGMRVLEPSAGAGHIADELKKTGAHVDTVEQNETLRQILKDKDHNLVGSDFLQYNPKEKYDRIVMNPPFEKLQDVDHVLHAFKLLKPGGKLVAIMSESPFFRQDKKAQQFREFFDEMGGESEKLPGAFKEGDRSTGVNSRKVIIEKPDDYVDKSLILDPLLKSMQELRAFVTNW